VPSAPSPATSNDVWEVTGGQGVAGSNPAVPTGRRVIPNILMPPSEPTKEPFHREMALPEAHAHHVPRPPTRAFVDTAEPAKPAVKGSKIAEPPRICPATPTAANPRTPSPAHRLTASQTRTGPQKLWDAGRPERTRQACPRHRRRDAYWHKIPLRTNRRGSAKSFGWGEFERHAGDEQVRVRARPLW
jgi:hypothetical protein